MRDGPMLFRSILLHPKLEGELFFYQNSCGTEQCTLEKINVLSVVVRSPLLHLSL